MIVNPVKTSSDTPWWQDPILTLLFGAVLSFGIASRSGAVQRRHDRAQFDLERAVTQGQAKAVGSLARFQLRLELTERRARESSATLRSLRVLDTVLAESGTPSTTIADLPVYALSFDEPVVRERTETVATLLARYQVCPVASQAGVGLDLRTAVAAALPGVQISAGAQAKDAERLADSGRKLADADAELLENAGVPSAAAVRPVWKFW